MWLTFNLYFVSHVFKGNFADKRTEREDGRYKIMVTVTEHKQR